MTYGLGDIATKFIAVFILPFFSRYLSPADYGIAAIITVSTVLLSGIADLGLSVSTFRFYQDDEIKDKKTILSTVIISVAIITTSIAILAFLFSKQLSFLLLHDHNFGYIIGLAFLSIPFSDIINTPINRFKLEGKAKTCTLIKVSRAITDILLKVFFIIYLERGITGLFEAQLINSVLYGIPFFVYIIKNIGFNYSFIRFKQMVSFGIPFAFSTIFFWVLNWADRFILGRLTDMTEVGLYTLGYTIGMAVMLPIGAFNTAWPAFYMTVTKDARAKRFFSLVLTYFSLIIGYFVLLVAVFSRDYFVFLTPTEFHEAYIIVPIIAVSYTFLGAYSVMITGTYIKGQTKYIFLTEILAVLVNLILMFLLIPSFGRVGAAWATLFSYLSLLIFINIFTFKTFYIQYEYRRLAQIAIALLTVFWLSQIIYKPEVPNLLLRALVTLGYPIMLYVLGFFNERELKVMSDFLTRCIRETAAGMKILAKIKKILILASRPLNFRERKIANNGERLVPKSTIDPEVIRHKSSYLFFKKIISQDQKEISALHSAKRKKISILDLGCGVGHGCYTLSKIKNVEITGVDNSQEAIEYAEEHFSRKNIKYIVSDIASYVKIMPKYDYVISRGVLEHIRGGLTLARKSKWNLRLMFDVPYNEKAGPNPYHLITQIREESFRAFPAKELFYEDIEGNVFDKTNKPEAPNMILCVSSAKNMQNIKNYKIKFPIPSWKGKELDY